MGMDVYGNAPKSEVGEYFRASIWTWPGVLNAIASTGVLPDNLVEAMAYNDGRGPNDEQAIALADALDKACEGMADEHVFVTEGTHYAEVGTASMGSSLLSQLTAFGAESGATVSTGGDDPYQTPVGFIREFAAFSRESGGFAVW